MTHAFYSAVEEALPLVTLTERLTLGPPSLGMLIVLLERSEEVQAFRSLVKEYLPKHERELMTGDEHERVERFARLFSQRYFPIDVMDFTFEDLVYDIPVQLGGFTYFDYHEFQDLRNGHQLLMSLVSYPFGVLDDEDKGVRVSLIEAVAHIAGEEAAKRIPGKGWEPDELHKALDGTKFEGLAHFADWIHANTGCWILDANPEDYMPEPWSREIVDGLTEQWPKVREIMDKAGSLVDWLEDAPQANFEALLNFVSQRMGNQVPKEQLPLLLELEDKPSQEAEGEEREQEPVF